MKFFVDSFIYTTKTHSQNDIVWVHMSAMLKVFLAFSDKHLAFLLLFV